MSELRRRRADRCTFPIEWGHNGEAGVTVRGGADRLLARRVVRSPTNLEAHHNGLRFQVDAPDFFHAELDLVFQG